MGSSGASFSFVSIWIVVGIVINFIIMGLYRWFFGYVFRLKDMHEELTEINESLAGINESLKEIVNQYQGP